MAATQTPLTVAERNSSTRAPYVGRGTP
jgi:hypothetical protein